MWDIDRLESEISEPLIAEWNNYLDWELEQYAKAIMSILPQAGSMIGSSPTSKDIKLTDPDEIGAFFNAINGG